MVLSRGGEAPSAPSTPVQVPARWRLRLAPPSSVKITGGEGAPCLASPSVSSLCLIFRVSSVSFLLVLSRLVG
ncbi:hypothetical protein DY000_02037233 [Brassica cretica]|uniref:Uncharacterized protein n=1 Tax=Brassica cretica TaxID=69181 RepID=A0ABQ7BL83_BRACR|nr:hypothetical protein DY000_02037233 [Brassica cretica]